MIKKQFSLKARHNPIIFHNNLLKNTLDISSNINTIMKTNFSTFYRMNIKLKSICFLFILAPSIFAQNSFIKNYHCYKGEIKTIDSNTFLFNEIKLIVINTDPSLLSIFTSGILYPEIFQEEMVKTDTSNIALDTTSITIPRIGFNYNIDSLTISDFKEIKTSNTLNIRKFSFLLFRNNFINPTEYTIVLTNWNANSETGFNSFIKHAILTRVEAGTILI